MPHYNLPNMAGVYSITNAINGHCYIGSAINMRKRQREHLHALRQGTHRSSYLQRAFTKYGEESFVFSVVEEVADSTLLIEREQYHMDLRSPEYNSRPQARNQLGLKHSKEAIAKMSASQKGRIAWNKGKKGEKQSQERIEKTRAVHLGKPRREETKRRSSETQKGKPKNPKSIAKMKATKKRQADAMTPEERSAKYGRPRNPEAIAKMKATKTGKSWSPARRAAYEAKRNQANTSPSLWDTEDTA